MGMDIEVKNASWEEKLSTHLQNLLVQRQLCDVKIWTADQQYCYGHLCVVAAFMPYLKVVGQSDTSMREVHLPDISQNIMQKLLAYCYGQTVSISAEQMGPLLVATDLLQMTDLHNLLAVEQSKHLQSNQDQELNGETKDSELVNSSMKSEDSDTVVSDGASDGETEGRGNLNDEADQNDEAAGDAVVEPNRGRRSGLRKRKLQSFTGKRLQVKKQRGLKIDARVKQVISRKSCGVKKGSDEPNVESDDKAGGLGDQKIHLAIKSDDQEGLPRQDGETIQGHTEPSQSDVIVKQEVDEPNMENGFPSSAIMARDEIKSEPLYVVDVSQQTDISLVSLENATAKKPPVKCEEEDCLDEEVARILTSQLTQGPQQLHQVTQTDFVGIEQFHKASQFPDHEYVSTQVDIVIKRKSPVDCKPITKPAQSAVYFNPAPMVQHGLQYSVPPSACMPQIPQVVQQVGIGFAPAAMPMRGSGPVSYIPAASVVERSMAVTTTSTTTAKEPMAPNNAVTSLDTTPLQMASPGASGYTALESVTSTPPKQPLTVKEAIGIIKKDLVSGNSSNSQVYAVEQKSNKEKLVPFYVNISKPSFTPRSLQSKPTGPKTGAGTVNSNKEEATGFIGPKQQVDNEKSEEAHGGAKETGEGKSQNNQLGAQAVQMPYSASAVVQPQGMMYPNTAGMMLNPQQRYMYHGSLVQPMYPQGNQLYYSAAMGAFGYTYPRWP